MIHVVSDRFSSQGLGSVLSEIFEKYVSSAPGFPNGTRGQKLVSVADFSGSHAGSRYDTYAFLLLDLDANDWWFQAQRAFRQEILKSRRLSFKALNDRFRRSALPVFINAANEIEGALIVVAVDKNTGSLFERSDDDEARELLGVWKKSVQEQVLRVAHLGSYLVAGFSAPNQNVLWIVDQDQIAANDGQLTQLTKIVAAVGVHYLKHDLGHLRCATTLSDDGSLAIEDLAAISDLAAGAFAEYFNAVTRQGRFPVKGVISLEPVGLSPKTRSLCRWLLDPGHPLSRLFLVLDRPNDGAGLRASKIKFEPYEPLVKTC
ncbi:hypothetical protein [Ancylobacter sp. TS-1]|uniref:hypothetical protein n=1 Tax=Ancylobacter sp. TS-1 TaxID=1850374 RepID=UPI001265C9E7|nr:hypothetical protein [Ancylobacter sp. TS-1]QFR34629.1 hypothetical protein GBB76_16790 [Ancylobacter sp. TS-1]